MALSATEASSQWQRRASGAHLKNWTSKTLWHGRLARVPEVARASCPRSGSSAGVSPASGLAWGGRRFAPSTGK
ncbi:MAG: hypothetical protein LBM04_00340, partial [Opitutaceae bacterium]|nr:hypothetical protein [Opitutaceae bacterium]